MSKQSVYDGKNSGAWATRRPLALSFPGHRHRTEERRSKREDSALANETPFLNPSQLARFEQVVLPHLNSPYNLARWLTSNDHTAEDLLQTAYLRAPQFFPAFPAA